MEKVLFNRVCSELRHAAGMRARPTPHPHPLELELVWAMHASIFYYGVRKSIYRIPVHAGPAEVLAMAVDETLGAAPKLLKSLARG